jgi:uncharacterized protein (DUF1800 family)
MASLNKFTGTWNKHLAAHLLRRTTYGVDYDTMISFGNKTLDECMNILLAPLGEPLPPINHNAVDPNVPIGETWVDKGTSQGVDGYRNQSLRSWSFELMLKNNANIREKMTMFWHNHFVIADINDARYNYIYIKLLRKYALGNFKQLTKDITIDPAMLNYLNGRDNTGQAPNENYARELMELFTLGKGTLAGPGDYTTFTEDDVKEIARVLTGWIDVRNSLPIKTEFRAGRHDVRAKTLSQRFGNVTINNAGADEYKNLIDIIFQKEEVGTFIATKIYRWFVQSKIDESTYDNIIIPLAKLIRDNDYEMLPAIKALLSSEHFYDECIIGAIIKNPIDFLLNPINPFKVQLPPISDNRSNPYFALNATANAMQMGIFAHPSVAGWSAYYQEPSFYRIWLNATSLPARKNYTDALASVGITVGQFRMQLNVIEVIDKIDNPQNMDAVVDVLNWILMPKPLADNQKDVLKGLINVGNSGNWQTAYTNYKNNPTAANKTIIVNRLRIIVVYMMKMPEYHLS